MDLVLTIQFIVKRRRDNLKLLQTYIISSHSVKTQQIFAYTRIITEI